MNELHLKELLKMYQWFFRICLNQIFEVGENFREGRKMCKFFAID